jgi:hypothetical protein
MPTLKLVQLDEDGWCMDIDPVTLRHVTAEFKEWLDTLDPNNDPYEFLKRDLPIVEAALNGTLPLPYKGRRPHSRDLGEGLLPREYTIISAPFYNTIRGANRSIETVNKDGKRYAWVEFEEPLTK